MSYKFMKRQNAIGWDWYLESDDCSSWVSQLVKEVIEELEAENARLREFAKELFKLADRGLMELDDDDFRRIVDEAEKLGVTDESR